MKALGLLVCLAGIQWAVCAGEKAGTNAPPSMEAVPSQAPDKEFHDPFAAENAPSSSKPQPKIADPLEGMNRAIFRFNDKFYFWVLKPAAKGYNKVAPRDFRECVHRFFTNIKFPVRVVNNALQGKFKAVGIETSRFVVNSTIGLAGFFDPANEWKLSIQPADLDQTLGFYTIPPGIYLEWPFFGPSSVRGTVGLVGDSFLSPWPYVDVLAVSLGVPPYEILNATSLRLGDYETFKNAALDPYVALRSAYFEHRRSLIKK